jgi:Transport and Golgi organisation 2
MFPLVCTVVVLVRPTFALLAVNRDERLDRPWDPPDAWWPDHPGTVAGRDRMAGGTWMGMNRLGVVATVLNRPGTLGPALGKRSRGELPLIALDQPTAASGAEAIAGLDANNWRGFNMVLADRNGAIFIRGLGHGRPQAATLPHGVSMVTAYAPNDLDSPRTARHLPRFEAIEPSGPDDLAAWLPILADRGGETAEQMNVVPQAGFGTVCASFVSLAAAGRPIWRFAPGPPHEAGFQPVFCDWGTAAIPAAPRDL